LGWTTRSQYSYIIKIAVTEASGHIGSALTRVLLNKNYIVRVLEHDDRRGFAGLDVEIVKGSMNDAQSLRHFCRGMDVVFHLAAKISIGIHFFNGYWFGWLSADYSESWLRDPRFVVGIILFFSGMMINIYSDQKLFRLRKRGKEAIIFRTASCSNIFHP